MKNLDEINMVETFLVAKEILSSSKQKDEVDY